MRKVFRCLVSFAMVILSFMNSLHASPELISLEKGNFKIVIDENECSQVRLALDALCRDFGKVMNFSPEIVTKTDNKGLEIVILNGTDNKDDYRLPEDKGFDGFESHRVFSDIDNDRIVLLGADMRGTIYAIYSFSEQILGVPPLWDWCDWQPEVKEKIEIPADFDFMCPSPQVRYRAWFPNDEDLFNPWRAKNKENNELWLETMLRLKLNTVEYTATVTTSGTLNNEAMLYKKYGLVLTSHLYGRP